VSKVHGPGILTGRFRYWEGDCPSLVIELPRSRADSPIPNRRCDVRELKYGKAIMLLGLLAAGLATGCGAQRAPEAPKKHSLADPPSAESLAALAKADAADGKVDKVVSKCITCRLAMEGSPEHSVDYGGYTLHFCSEECKKAFSENPELK
jgi:hypothetical protein